MNTQYKDNPEDKTPENSATGSVLERIDSPGDVRNLGPEELETLAAEIRAEIIHTVSVNGGHLASSLGVVELTLALAHVYDLERDCVVWDVGHQSYAYKLLTGRRETFRSLRLKGGLSGYPRRSESPYDVFGTGHSSTSISAALGMAVARDQAGEDHRVIAVIGDGAMTGGLALEALNNAGHLGTDLLVVLNDNEMSIDHNVGALSSYFSRLITGRKYKRTKEDVASFVKRIIGPRLTHSVQRLEQSVKGFITAGGFFQELGFNYVGPVDGHDLPVLIGFFANLKEMHGPILFHCVTTKGKGYRDAEKDPQKYHGVRPSDFVASDTEGEARPPEKLPEKSPIQTFTAVFAEAVIAAAEKDPRVVGVTAAMPSGTGLNKFCEQFPDRFFDVGICEQHAVTFSAGLAAKGMRPVCAIYSTFLQRGFDQVIHDVCLQNLPVVFALDRAGLVGEDCPTHAGVFDLSFLRCVPNLTVLAPRDDVDLRLMLAWALQQAGPVAIRYPRDMAPTIGAPGARDVTRGEMLREGRDGCFLSVGPCAASCMQAAVKLEAFGLSVGVADARFVKPLDNSLLEGIGKRPIITVEENALLGGFGSGVLEYFEMAQSLPARKIKRIGLADAFTEHARRAEQLVDYGLDAQSLAAEALAFLSA